MPIGTTLHRVVVSLIARRYERLSVHRRYQRIKVQVQLSLLDTSAWEIVGESILRISIILLALFGSCTLQHLW